MATLRTQYENYLFVNQEPHISFEEWERRIYTPTIESFIKIWEREETIKKWEATGLLYGLDKDMTFKTQKINLAELMESEASKLLKKEWTMLDELNQYLIMLSEMDKIGIRRKLVLLQGYIDNIKKNV
jgi:hypothetical protein